WISTEPSWLTMLFSGRPKSVCRTMSPRFSMVTPSSPMLKTTPSGTTKDCGLLMRHLPGGRGCRHANARSWSLSALRPRRLRLADHLGLLHRPGDGELDLSLDDVGEDAAALGQAAEEELVRERLLEVLLDHTAHLA